MKKKMKQLAGHEEAGATPIDHTSLEPTATALDDDTPMLDPDDEGEDGQGETPMSHPASKAGKPKFCDNCGKELLARIQVCAGCKRVAYCNYRCQKASWKVHKKTCSYALRKDSKESTG